MNINSLRVIHVDDDPGFIDRLSGLLDDFEDINIEYLGGFENSVKALEFLNENEVDLIFMDVEMPDQNGWWLAEQVKEMNIDIIFITAHSTYALKAFEVCALNFIVKPPSVDRLRELLILAQNRTKNGIAEDKEQVKSFYEYINPDAKLDKIFINQVGKMSIVKLEDIVYFNALKAYTNIYIKDGEIMLTSKSIRSFQDILERNKNFSRVSRSAILNKDYIKNIQRDMKTKKISFEMSTGEIIETPFKTKDEAMEIFG